MATETVTAAPRVSVRRGRVLKRWWFARCSACCSEAALDRELIGACKSHADAITAAEQHLREHHAPSEPPC